MSAIEFIFFLKHHILYQSKENGTKKWQKACNSKIRAQSKKGWHSILFLLCPKYQAELRIRSFYFTFVLCYFQECFIGN